MILVIQDAVHMDKKQNGKGWKWDEAYTLDKWNTQAIIIIEEEDEIH